MLDFENDYLKPLWVSTLHLLLIVFCVSPLAAQSNRTMILVDGGAWHLRSRIPLGSDALLLEPAHRVVKMLASVDCPEFAGWTLTAQHDKPVLLDVSGKPVKHLPS